MQVEEIFTWGKKRKKTVTRRISLLNDYYYSFPNDLDTSRQVAQYFTEENDNTSKFVKHVSTETSVIFS